MILDPEDEAFNEIERRAQQRKEAVKAAMKKQKAFPNPHYRDESGITVRDYFAARVMQAILPQYEDVFNDDTQAEGEPSFPELLAKDAYIMADAMLKAREA
jgi:hypothetical protein